jgi:sortase A
MAKEERENKKENKVGYLKYLGILLLLGGLSVLIFTFYPILKAYFTYYFNPEPVKEIRVEVIDDTNQEIQEPSKEEKDDDIVFLNNDFGLYIPKINANAKVIENVDPYDEDEYTNALYTGVAHAKGSSTPNVNGNVFLFAHSAVNFYERRKYNVYFYLLGELKKDDPIYVSYDGDIYNYKVLEIKKVNPTEVKYLGTYSDQDTLTLMTCWPAGMNVKRMIVTAVRDNQ